MKIVEDKQGLWARATLAPDSAIKIALARVPGGTITKAELEEEDNRSGEVLQDRTRRLSFPTDQ